MEPKTLILATGLSDLNEGLLSAGGRGFTVTEICSTKEELVSHLNQNQPPDIVVTSYMLPGEADILEVLYSLRLLDVRVIFVAPGFNPTDPTMKKLCDMGIYDIVPGSTIGDVIERIRVPNTFKDAHNLFEVNGQKLYNAVQYTQANRFGRRPAKSGDDKPDNVIGIWSPTPSGKTFVSVNMAAALAETGCNVALVDFNTASLAIHTWLGIPRDDDGIFAALESWKEPDTDIRNYFYRCSYLPSLNILTADPMGPRPSASVVKEKNGVQFLKHIAEEFDYVIVDTASPFDDPLTKACFAVSEKVFLITDLDNHHLLTLHKELETVEKSFHLDSFKLLINRFVESPELSVNRIKLMTDMSIFHCIPETYREVLESIKGGVPAVLISPVLRTCFRELHNNL